MWVGFPVNWELNNYRDPSIENVIEVSNPHKYQCFKCMYNWFFSNVCFITFQSLSVVTALMC